MPEIGRFRHKKRSSSTKHSCPQAERIASIPSAISKSFSNRAKQHEPLPLIPHVQPNFLLKSSSSTGNPGHFSKTGFCRSFASKTSTPSFPLIHAAKRATAPTLSEYQTWSEKKQTVSAKPFGNSSSQRLYQFSPPLQQTRFAE